ncbi:MAG: 16S rRNA (guanine(966)-N(2))-methyltransferase RsmD [Nitrospirae bacterium]|nr:16S rRNA (guanine(966)-N(2))-methyltransferase RsmD [Nitrospirota bacterium]MBI3353188.1 16S rRNA (guanine(966)-N(2))-methyltransferase RsmD [Nitrospirota bacterium]
MIKISGGLEKGKHLSVLGGHDLRPTGAKVRQALFNILGDKIIHSNFLDLFAGTGAIGIEALSRGADHSTFVEKNKDHFKLLKKNIDLFQFTHKSTLLCLDVFKYKISEAPGSASAERGVRGHWERSEQAPEYKKDVLFDIVFLDPPYLAGLLEKLLPVLGESDMIQKSGIMVVEHFKKISLKDDYGHFSQMKRYPYGDTILSVYQYR